MYRRCWRQVQLTAAHANSDMTIGRRFWSLWLRVSLVLGALLLFAAVLYFAVPFNDETNLGQRILDIGDIALFIVGRFILTSLFGMQIEGPSLLYYSVALIVTWMLYSALLAPIIFSVVFFAPVNPPVFAQLAESGPAISRGKRRSVLPSIIAGNLLAVFVWRIALTNALGHARDWTGFLILLGTADCVVLAAVFATRIYFRRQ